MMQINTKNQTKNYYFNTTNERMKFKKLIKVRVKVLKNKNEKK